MAGHKIGNEILLQPLFFGEAEEFFAEFIINCDIRLAHTGKDVRRAMLRGHLKLAADVVTYKLYKEAVVGVCHHIVKADTASDKHLLYSGDLFNLPKKLYILCVVCDEILAGGGNKASLVLTNAVFKLLFAGGSAEICRRSADIVDILIYKTISDQVLTNVG